MHEVLMPASGMAMTEGLLVKWLKQPGEAVTRGEPLAEIETDKATVELDSPAAGVLGPPLAAEGAIVPVGTVLVRILDEAETKAGTGAQPAATSDSSAARAHAAGPTVLDLPRPVPATETVRLVTSPVPRPTRVVTAPLAPPLPAGRRSAGPAVQTPLERPAHIPGPGEELVPLDVDGLAPDDVVEWLQTMMVIREFEQACAPLAEAGKIPGGVHSAAGQEAVAVGAIRALKPTDIVTSSHRSHHHSLAKGLTPRSIMAELYGKATGCLGGRGGHMHLADFSIGLFGSNGIVGAGLGIAMGAALAAQMRRLDQVALGFFGDGGANTGRVWEHINLAALWKLPLIAVCENNLYAVETYVGRAMAGPSIARRAAGFGLPAVVVDGQDVAAMYRATAQARERAISGEGPTFIEAQTYRYEGHNTDDVGNYREPAEVESWRRTRDPIVRLKAALEAAGIISAEQFDGMLETARATVNDAIRFAEQSPWPDPARALDTVTGLPVRLEDNV